MPVTSSRGGSSDSNAKWMIMPPVRPSMARLVTRVTPVTTPSKPRVPRGRIGLSFVSASTAHPLAELSQGVLPERLTVSLPQKIR
jgi:hypothetical protein